MFAGTCSSFTGVEGEAGGEGGQGEGCTMCAWRSAKQQRHHQQLGVKQKQHPGEQLGTPATAENGKTNSSISIGSISAKVWCWTWVR